MIKRFERAWIGALVLAFLTGLIAGLPARLALRLAPEVVASRLAEVEGTLWRGQARATLVGLEPLALQWTLAPTSLLLAAPRFALDVVHPLGDYRGTATLRGGTLVLSDGSLRTTLSPLTRYAGLPPGTLLGSVVVQDIDATLAADGIRSLGCSGSVSGVTVTGDAAPLALGDLNLTCSDSAAGPTIVIADGGGGPLALQANIGFAPSWRYLVDGTAAARPGAPPALAQALPLLGQADGPDRVRFRYSGELLRFNPAR